MLQKKKNLPKTLKYLNQFTSADILRYVGVMIMMGINKRPELHMH